MLKGPYFALIWVLIPTARALDMDVQSLIACPGSSRRLVNLVHGRIACRPLAVRRRSDESFSLGLQGLKYHAIRSAPLPLQGADADDAGKDAHASSGKGANNTGKFGKGTWRGKHTGKTWKSSDTAGAPLLPPTPPPVPPPCWNGNTAIKRKWRTTVVAVEDWVSQVS